MDGSSVFELVEVGDASSVHQVVIR
jgi:hypothetical protein